MFHNQAKLGALAIEWLRRNASSAGTYSGCLAVRHRSRADAGRKRMKRHSWPASRMQWPPADEGGKARMLSSSVCGRSCRLALGHTPCAYRRGCRDRIAASHPPVSQARTASITVLGTVGAHRRQKLRTQYVVGDQQGISLSEQKRGSCTCGRTSCNVDGNLLAMHSSSQSTTTPDLYAVRQPWTGDLVLRAQRRPAVFLLRASRGPLWPCQA